MGCPKGREYGEEGCTTKSTSVAAVVDRWTNGGGREVTDHESQSEGREGRLQKRDEPCQIGLCESGR